MIYLYKNTEHKKAKGVSKAVVRNIISFNDYKNTLETNKSLVRDVARIRSFNQQLFTYKHATKALTSFYDTMNMLDSIICEPYAYIEYNSDDLDNTIINEVEDIKQITEYIEIIEVEKCKLILI